MTERQSLFLSVPKKPNAAYWSPFTGINTKWGITCSALHVANILGIREASQITVQEHIQVLESVLQIKSSLCAHFFKVTLRCWIQPWISKLQRFTDLVIKTNVSNTKKHRNTSCQYYHLFGCHATVLNGCDSEFDDLICGRWIIYHQWMVGSPLEVNSYLRRNTEQREWHPEKVRDAEG